LAKEMLVLLLICPISSLQFDKRPPRVPILTVRRNLITSHALLGTTLSAYLAGLCLENGLSGKRYDFASKADESPIGLASLP